MRGSLHCAVLFETSFGRDDGIIFCVGRFSRAEVAGAELAIDARECKADAVAIGERRRGVKLKLRQWGGAEELAEFCGFAVELRGVREVLELASAAGSEVGTGRSGALRFGRCCCELECGGHLLVAGC